MAGMQQALHARARVCISKSGLLECRISGKDDERQLQFAHPADDLVNAGVFVDFLYEGLVLQVVG